MSRMMFRNQPSQAVEEEAPPLDPYTQLMKDGAEALNKRNLEFAEHCFEEALLENPHSSEARYLLGTIYFQRDEFNEAEAAWLKAIELNPLEKGVYINLGNLYYAREEVYKAIYYWKQFITVKPTHAMVHYNMGMAYAKLGKIRDSNRFFKQFLALKPNSSDAIALRNRIAESVDVVNHNLKQAEIHLANGHLQKAVQAYQQSYGLIPLHHKMYLHYANTLYQLGKYQEASKVYQDGLDECNDNPNLLINYAVCQEKLGANFQAMWACLKMVKLYPKKVPEKVQNRYHTLWSQVGDKEVAIQLQRVQTLMAQYRFDEADYLAGQVAEVLMQARPDRIKEAMQFKDHIRYLYDPFKQAAKITLDKAEALHAAKDFKESIVYYKKYLDIMPDGPTSTEVRRKIDETNTIIQYGELDMTLPARMMDVHAASMFADVEASPAPGNKTRSA